MSNEKIIWDFFRSKGLTDQGVAGLMGNLFHESLLSPKNVQNSSGWNDDDYTLQVNNGTYSADKFINDKIGYGLAQWTTAGRKKNLYNSSKGDISDLSMQLNFLYQELSTSYRGVLATLKSTTDIRTASNKVLLEFEAPKKKDEKSVQDARASKSSEYYNKHAGSSSSGGGSGDTTNTKGHKLVEEAKKHLGVPYQMGGNGPDKFDCSGFIKYVYNKAINFGMTARTAYTQHGLSGSPAPDSTNGWMAGDLIFFTDTYNSGNTPNISHVGMAIGEGDSFIQASGEKVNISSLSGSSYWKEHYYGGLRILDPSESFSGGSSDMEYTSASPADGITGLAGGLPLSGVDYYEEELNNAINTLDSSNNSYCALMDLTKGGEFKFYLPESYTETLPVSWENQVILGRSTPATGYTSSGPRSISLDLIIMAGAGYYDLPGKSLDEVMNIMYDDINFLRSLVYPDYDHTIVRPPSVVLLSCGAKTRLKGVMSNISVSYYEPYDSQNRSMKVGINFTISQVSDNPPGLTDVRTGTIESY